MKLFCRHDWEILTNEEIESLYDRSGVRIDYYKKRDIERVYCRIRITILTCNKCGKIKRYKDFI